MNDDRFADYLDAIVNGTAPGEAAPPADIARRIQQATNERLDGERRAAIWRDLMAAHRGGASTTGGPGPLAQPALTAPDTFNPWVRRRRPSLSREPRMGIVHEAMQTGITAMAIVMVVIAAFVAFPIIRGGDATPSVTPTAWAAAPTMEAAGYGATGSTETPKSGDSMTIAADTAPPIYPRETAPATGGDNATGKPYPGKTYVTPTSIATYHHPQSNECRVEPLTVDDVMAIVEGGSSNRVSETGAQPIRRPITEDEYHDLTQSHRSWLACHFHGTGLQLLALESDDMIRADVLRASMPAYSPTLVVEMIESLVSDSASQPDTSGFTWDPPADTFVPMIADWDPGTAPTVNEDGKVTVTIVWMNRDGEMITGDDDAEMPVAGDLPVHWTYVWSEVSGEWLLDSYGP